MAAPPPGDSTFPTQMSPIVDESRSARWTVALSTVERRSSGVAVAKAPLFAYGQHRGSYLQRIPTGAKINFEYTHFADWGTKRRHHDDGIVCVAVHVFTMVISLRRGTCTALRRRGFKLTLQRLEAPLHSRNGCVYNKF